jgi:hypothetical protein
MRKETCVSLVSITFDPAVDCGLSGAVEYDAGLGIGRLENLGIETAAVALERLFIVSNRLSANNSIRMLQRTLWLRALAAHRPGTCDSALLWAAHSILGTEVLAARAGRGRGRHLSRNVSIVRHLLRRELNLHDGPGQSRVSNAPLQ